MADEPNTDPAQPADPNTQDGGTGTNEPSTEVIDNAKSEAVNELLKTLGVSSTDDLTSIVAAKNEADKANQTDLENSQADLKKANDNNAELTSQLASLKATNAVLKAGVTAEHVDDATILAQARVSSGQAKDIDKAIKDVLKSNPQFTGDIRTGPDGTAINNQNISNPNSSITKDQFNKMDYGERLKVYTENPDLYKKFTK
ncbi:hypothetical protein JMJ99_06640 [Companilactobacillus zhachilii]|uniref:hypothetical protein n=1 Tax=Companilactobacillus zhachilii TaxID=2304606 RepID=UPI0019212901|nr:hypothetical protein [Companilactobacillus zhachilii]MBL3531043.1 hypothetical protein [Companilactobacillus zhachilii]